MGHVTRLVTVQQRFAKDQEVQNIVDANLLEYSKHLTQTTVAAATMLSLDSGHTCQSNVNLLQFMTYFFSLSLQ